MSIRIYAIIGLVFIGAVYLLLSNSSICKTQIEDLAVNGEVIAHDVELRECRPLI